MLQYHQGMCVAVGGSSGNTAVHNNVAVEEVYVVVGGHNDGKEGQWLLRQKHNRGRGKNQGNKDGISAAVIEQVEGAAARGPLSVVYRPLLEAREVGEEGTTRQRQRARRVAAVEEGSSVGYGRGEREMAAVGGSDKRRQ
ncbi:hypothetical protein BHM03_00041878 [Ensete ventricosum]|uniref:Uncharacterized protein n=1 Tax=Ensete ventricosum TaxID=4639 RepID=A0A445MKC1_ENSVE|nr:hypothetical protein BHM03_00041878 [Ensete ventricosum]